MPKQHIIKFRDRKELESFCHTLTWKLFHLNIAFHVIVASPSGECEGIVEIRSGMQYTRRKFNQFSSTAPMGRIP